MAGERSYFLNKSVVRGRHVYKHIWMPGINEVLSVEKERTMQSPWQFHYFCGEEEALCRRSLTVLNMPPAIIQQLAFITVQDL